ncbi:MAG: L-serine ammonia-lyase, iron-sulfur-dependent subunit beta [Bacteroidia bacterium]
MTEPSGIFDMLGPIMIGPSSSHTAGVVRIGRVAHYLLEGMPTQVEVVFYNSFAHTYRGHGSDKAIVAGLMGWAPDDERIREALQHAEKAGMHYQFTGRISSAQGHPNTLFLRAQGGEIHVELVGISRGGGLISITEVDGLHANFTGQLVTLVIDAQDRSGSVAFIADVIAHDEVNIATLTVSRRAKEGMAKLIFELDADLSKPALSYLGTLRWVKRVVKLPPV